MVLIDTHTHNSDEAFAGEEDLVIRRCLDAGVQLMLQPDVDSRERERMFALVDRWPGVLRPMIGLYPGSVDRDWRTEIERMLPYAERSDIVAVGEIGLDFHFSTEFAAEQREALRWQLEWAAGRDLPVNIHLRDATAAFFEVLDSCSRLPRKGSLHAFSGSYETFRRISGYGEWYVGIGGVITFKKATLPETVRRIPLDRIVLETDAPYMAPVPRRGTRNDSSNLPLVVAKIAEVKGVTPGEVAAVTTQNALKLFNLCPRTPDPRSC